MDEVEENKIFNVPLSQITLIARTERALAFIKNKLFATGLLVSSCQENLILKQGNNFPKPSQSHIFEKYTDFDNELFEELLVLQCEPLYQGLLNLKTSIITTDYIFSNIPNTDTPIIPAVEIPQMSSFLDVYRLPQLQQKYVPGQFLDAIILQKKDDTWRKCTLKITLNYKQIKKVVNTVKKGSDMLNIDINNTVIVSKEYALKCGWFNGDYVELKPVNSVDVSSTRTSNDTKNVYVCQIQVLEDINQITECGSETAAVFVLPSVFLTLKTDWAKFFAKQVDVFIRRHRPPHLNASGNSASTGYTPPFAEEVHLSCVQCPSYNPKDSYTDLLQLYFATPRLASRGGVICLDTKDDPEYWQNVTESSEHRHPVVFFKVMKILPKVPGCKTYLVDSKHTNLYLNGSIPSFVPSVMSYVVRDCAKSLTLPGLQDYILKVLQLLNPYVAAKEKKTQIFPSILLSGSTGSGKSSIVWSVAAFLNMHTYEVNCHELCGETAGATEARIKHTLQRAQSFTPCILLLRNVDVLGKDRDGTAEDPRVAAAFHELVSSLLHQDSSKFPTLLIATTSSFKSLSSDVLEGFLHHIELAVPEETTRLIILNSLFEEVDLRKDVNLKHVAQRTAGFILGDFYALVSQVRRTAYDRITNYCKEALCGHVLSWKEECHIRDVGYPVIQEDIEAALNTLQTSHSDSLGAPKIPNVQWEDVGGLVSVKSEILDTIQLPLQHPEFFAEGLRRSGVLLYGPPGTGKTLLAKAVATECSLNFLSIKGPELINMYVGQSEENIREVFHRARSASPCVIFFDELDSLAPNRGRSGDSGGVMDRVVSQLLAELDGLHKATDVFVIGATNRPDLLDPALLRPGRFDKMLYLGVSENKDTQLKILKALTRKFVLDEDCSFEDIVNDCPHNMTGADFYALCSDAMLNALKRKIDLLESGVEIDQQRVSVCLEDFSDALENLVPSVSAEELRRFKTIKENLDMEKKVIDNI